MSVVIQDQAEFYTQASKHFKAIKFNEFRGFRKYAILNHGRADIVSVARDVGVRCKFLGAWHGPTETYYVYGMQANDKQAMMIKMAL